MKINAKIAYSLFCSLIIAAGSEAADPALVQKYVEMMSCKDDLYLGGHNLGTGKRAAALAEALGNNETLTSLRLEHNQIGCAEVKILAKAFEKNKTLTSLTFALNSIDDEGAKALAEVLENNNTLTVLKINSNYIGNEGAKALAKALKRNKKLIELNLYYNHINNEGAKALAKVLKRNNTLTVLNLGLNHFQQEGVKAFAKTLKINSTLTVFEYCPTGTKKNIRSNINKRLKRNIEISKIRKDLMIKAVLAASGNQYDPTSRFFDLPKELVKPILDFLIQLKMQEIIKNNYLSPVI